ncbi:MAG: arsenite efflux transporter metallochaperone ArsD [Thermoleophilia bacterium]|nr:arsenite efflux transporter metallochaperone ArsD [Thermoleophilia bacterium]
MTTTPDAAAPAIRVFEPALCCNTGVCGPDVDEALVRFTADLDYLRSRDVDISRHNLANDPQAFADDPHVAGFLKTVGSAGLPLVLVDGVTVAIGRYPDRAELLRLAGREGGDAQPAASGGCCGGGDASPTGRCEP